MFPHPGSPQDNNRGAPRIVAIIGGGRWARQIATALGRVCAPGSHITLCSPTNPTGWLKWIEQGHGISSTGVRYTTTTQITNILRDKRISHVIVARSAHDHATTAIALLNATKSVYVEKPVAINEAEAKAVVAAAVGRVCVVGLVLLFASNIRRFAEIVAALGPLQSIAITWADTTAEHRYGAPYLRSAPIERFVTIRWAHCNARA
jgi:predicted dehydrogenase